MHEMGIVYHVADEVEKIAAQNDICHIGSVTLQIGEMTGVIFDYMSDLWGWVSDKSSLLKGSRLLYEQIPAGSARTAEAGIPSLSRGTNTSSSRSRRTAESGSESRKQADHSENESKEFHRWIK